MSEVPDFIVRRAQNKLAHREEREQRMLNWINDLEWRIVSLQERLAVAKEKLQKIRDGG
jgi:hypothetical protein